MSVTIWTDQGLNRQGGAANLLRHVTQNGEAGNNPQRLGCQRGCKRDR